MISFENITTEITENNKTNITDPLCPTTKEWHPEICGYIYFHCFWESDFSRT